MEKGVFCATKKDGTVYYRSSITYKGKHISLGSFETEREAADVYQCALFILQTFISLKSAAKQYKNLPFPKIVTLVNYRDNGIYIKTPIYLYKKYFLYYLDENTPLKFDIEDLFYYSTHKIQKRGGYLYVADYGMQVNILSRYGIKNYAVCGRDYCHRNNDEYDFTYSNIEIINGYYGVCAVLKDGKTYYKSSIHLNGNYLIGIYESEIDAAIAYNKAADIAKENGCNRSFQTNYILSLTAGEYAECYHKLKISSKIKNYKSR